MVHRLTQRHPLNAIGANPLVCMLRYRCDCAANEVLSISAVIDVNASEEQFIWTMQRLWRDVKFEVEQHLNPPERTNGQAAGDSLRVREADQGSAE